MLSFRRRAAPAAAAACPPPAPPPASGATPDDVLLFEVMRCACEQPTWRLPIDGFLDAHCDGAAGELLPSRAFGELLAGLLATHLGGVGLQPLPAGHVLAALRALRPDAAGGGDAPLALLLRHLAAASDAAELRALLAARRDELEAELLAAAPHAARSPPASGAPTVDDALQQLQLPPGASDTLRRAVVECVTAFFARAGGGSGGGSGGDLDGLSRAEAAHIRAAIVASLLDEEARRQRLSARELAELQRSLDASLSCCPPLPAPLAACARGGAPEGDGDSDGDSSDARPPPPPPTLASHGSFAKASGPHFAPTQSRRLAPGADSLPRRPADAGGRVRCGSSSGSTSVSLVAGAEDASCLPPPPFTTRQQLNPAVLALAALDRQQPAATAPTASAAALPRVAGGRPRIVNPLAPLPPLLALHPPSPVVGGEAGLPASRSPEAATSSELVAARADHMRTLRDRLIAAKVAERERALQEFTSRRAALQGAAAGAARAGAPGASPLQPMATSHRGHGAAPASVQSPLQQALAGLRS